MGAHRDGGGIRFGAWLAPHAMKHADAKGFVLIHRYRERVPSDALNPGMSGDSVAWERRRTLRASMEWEILR